MSASGSCIRCAKELTAPSALGLCVQCQIETGERDATLAAAEQTRTAAVSPTGPTATYDPKGDTLVFVDRSPQASLSAARAAMLAADHKFIDVVKMTNSGGMGELYRAYDPATALSVVVKFVRWDTHSIPNLTRFATEARALARVQHENVARLFSFKADDDAHMVMEDVPGGSLSDRLRNGPLAPDEAAKILTAAARGVADANRQGVIHRDLKPGNILMTTQGPDAKPKVADFGIAKDLDAFEEQTKTLAILGTPGYLSPEQADWRSAECDARSDVWGLAATFYCCVTGQAPFDRNLRPQAILTEPLVPPAAIRKDLPAELNAIICKGLEKHPSDRYQTADEFADDLARYLAKQPVLARPRPLPIRLWRRARRTPKAVAASLLVAALALAALVAVMFQKDKVPDPVVKELTAEQKIEAKMQDLKDGKTVTLVEETGLPDWSKPAAGTYSIDKLVVTGDSMGLQSADFGICQITPKLPINMYDIHLELADVAALPGNQPGVPTYHLGVIFGYEEFPGPEKAKLSHGISMLWQDVDQRRNQQLPIQKSYGDIARQLFIQRPGKTVSTPTEKVGQFRFDPSRNAAQIGQWRIVRIAVTPEVVEIFWRNEKNIEVTVARITSAQFAYAGSNLGKVLQNHLPDFQGGLPPWNPSGAIGLIVDQCVVGVRNVKIVPR